MNTFKRKALFTAVLAGLGAAGSAEAVYLNPNGLGQVLVYPYYTVQSIDGNAWNTYLSVVNTTSRAKAVKVRVLEGKTSAEVLDFNLFLSPNDMWTAVIFPGAGDGAAARIGTTDRSCTNPVGGLRLDLGGAGEAFRNFQYDSGADARPGIGLDRTREGYVEIIEMGTLSGTWATAVTHGATGNPANCAVVQGPFVTPPVGEINPPGGGMSGTGTLINVNNGQDAGYKADALDAWSNVAQYSIPSATLPNIGAATPPTSTVVRSGSSEFSPSASSITAYRNTFVPTSSVVAGARAVASVFMHSSVINEYVLDTGSLSQTDWVLTQPVKRLFVTGTAAAQPYTRTLVTAGACEDIEFTFFNREEATGTAAGADFSPSPETETGQICWETTVLSIRNGAAHTAALPDNVSGVLGSRNVTAIDIESTFQNGWARMRFNGAGALLGMGSSSSDRTTMDSTAITSSVLTNPVTFIGLPVTGFMVRTFQNGGLTCASGTCQGNYGSLFNHSYETLIRDIP